VLWYHVLHSEVAAEAVREVVAAVREVVAEAIREVDLV
jgi:hypothetical protein